MRCPHRDHNDDFDTAEALLLHLLEHTVNLEETVSLDFSTITTALDAHEAEQTEVVAALRDLAAKAGTPDAADQAQLNALADRLNASTTALKTEVATDDPAPVPVDTGAPSEPAAPPASTEPTAPAQPTEPVQPVGPAQTVPGRPVYVYQGIGDIDPAAWPVSPYKTTDGVQLYYFASDTDGGVATGAGTSWAVYQGNVVTV